MRLVSPYAMALILLLSGCSTPSRQSIVYGPGEKVTVDRLAYDVIDSETQTHLGDGSNPRNPQNRFILVQIAVSNSGNTDAPIPGLALIDDSGKAYPELADGAGVPQWLGVIRKVGPGQTERGTVLFDAPSSHYKLKLTDESNESDIYSDIPLTFVHEQMERTTPSIQQDSSVTPLK